MSTTHVDTIMIPGRWSWLTPHRLLLAGILAIALLVRLWGIGFGLPLRSARPDEEDIVVTALRFGSGDLNPYFFNYPTLFIYLTFVGYVIYLGCRLLVGQYDLTDFLLEYRLLPWSTCLIPRSLSAVAGVVTVYLVYRLGCRWFDRRTGLIAAFLLAVAHLHVRDSHYGVTDTAMVCGVVLAVLMIGRCVGQAGWRPWLLAGAISGLAASTKYNAFLLAAPLVVAAWLSMTNRSCPMPASAAVRCLGIGLMGLAVFFLAGTPYALLDYRAFLHDVWTESGRVYADRPGPIPRAWWTHLRYSLWYGLGWPVFLAGWAGVILMVRKLGPRSAVLLAFPAVYAVIAGAGHKAPFRYALPLVPFLCLSAAVTLAALLEYARMSRGNALSGLVTAVLTLAAAGPSIAAVVHSDRLLCRTDSRVLARDWMGLHAPAGSSVYQLSTAYGAIPLLDDPAVLERLRDDPKTPSFRRRLLAAEISYIRERRLPTYARWDYDPAERRFHFAGQPQEGLPDYVLVHTHPVQWKRDPLPAELLAEHYRLVHRIVAHDAEAARTGVFDSGMYLPFAGFAGTTRPGPNVSIYLRWDLIDRRPNS